MGTFKWILLIILFSVGKGKAQEQLNWKVLADVEFELQYLKEYEMRLMVPVFGKMLKAYEGKEVVLSGYVIPLDSSGKMYVLSKNPYASCFFCGGAGQETIVELWLKAEAIKRYKMDQKLTFKGILRLNSTDINHFNYILEKASPYP